MAYSTFNYSDCSIYSALVSGVEHVSAVRKSLVDGALRGAFLKPDLILDVWHLQQAAYIAKMAEKNGSMKTKSVYTEILYNLSPSRNINDCFKRFGLEDSTEQVLVVTFDPEDMQKSLSSLGGKAMPMSSLSTLSNESEVIKFYKIKEEELSCGSLQEAIGNRIATKGIAAY